MRTWRGGTLVALDPDALAARLGEVPLAIHRADLHAVLRAAFDGPLHLGARCAGVEHGADGVTARFADGRTLRAAVLVGADGLRSAVRTALHGDVPPVYAGYTAWRAVVPFDPAALTPGETFGRGQRFGQVPLPGGQAYWFATASVPEGAAFPEGEKAALRRLFGGWHAPVEALVEATPAEALIRTDLYDRPPLAPWGRGRVTLLGDAAHPTTPNLGQGAGMALEDAAALARRLASGGDVEEALRAYEAARAARTAAVVRASRAIGAVGQWRSPAAVAARTALFRLTPGRAVVERTARFAAYDAFQVGDG
jgi:2-polyprenyl-6-methoxyphenol hydroxylase-like FAD-dependent oxidoreductase